jgi:predicted enzyme related to lactoylglutathione lyase
MRASAPEVSFLLRVSDLERARRFYEAGLDLEATLEEPSHLRLRRAGSRWEIVCTVVPAADERSGEQAAPRAPLAGAWLQLRVADVDAVFARALASGGLAVAQPQAGAGGERVGRLMDPDGYLITLVGERKKAG